VRGEVMRDEHDPDARRVLRSAHAHHERSIGALLPA
jgi:hypothetical protein